MLDLINEIELCIQNNCLRCALGMALTLPDICAHVEYPNENSSDKRYIDWCEKYLFNQGFYPTHVVDNSKPPEQWEKVREIEPKMCYKLRCAFLHSGNLELNQRKNDNYPIFDLKITSEKEEGIYIDSIMSIDQNKLIRKTVDCRLLTRVLCNAAKEYYNNSTKKDHFINHHINIVNVDNKVEEIHKRNEKFAKMQASKRDITSYEELTEHAKILLNHIKNKNIKDVKNLVEDDDYLIAFNELLDGGFILITN